MLFIGTSSTYLGALLGMAVVGSGGGLVEMTVSANISDLLPSERGFALNFSHLVFGLSAASPLLITWQTQATRTWRTAYLGLGMAALVLVPVALLPKWPVFCADRHIDLQAAAVLVRRPRLWAIATSQALYVASEVSVVSWAVSYLMTAEHATLAQANAAISVFWATLAVGRLICGLLSRHVALSRLLLGLSLSASFSMTVALLFPFKRLPFVSCVLVGVAGLFYSGIFSTVLAYAGNAYPRYSGTVFGLIMAAGAAGAMAGPWALGIIAEETTISSAFWLVVFLMLGMAIIYLILGSKGKNSAYDRT
jgi:fucose permease